MVARAWAPQRALGPCATLQSRRLRCNSPWGYDARERVRTSLGPSVEPPTWPRSVRGGCRNVRA
eukprot:2536518-Pyramimonas_sp.AAC.1